MGQSEGQSWKALVPWKVDKCRREEETEKKCLVRLRSSSQNPDFCYLSCPSFLLTHKCTLFTFVSSFSWSFSSFSFCQQHVGCRDTGLSVQVLHFNSAVLSCMCLSLYRFILLPYPFYRVELVTVIIKEAYRGFLVTSAQGLLAVTEPGYDFVWKWCTV